MKTAIQQAIESIKDYRNLSTADFDTCNTILLHLASMIEKEKEIICEFTDNYVENECYASLEGHIEVAITTEEYYNKTFNNK
jgi:hypothetical protein